MKLKTRQRKQLLLIGAGVLVLLTAVLLVCLGGWRQGSHTSDRHTDTFDEDIRLLDLFRENGGRLDLYGGISGLPEANPYGPEDFTVNEQGFMTCLAGESVIGIDVSVYQQSIDWEQVRAAGVAFVFIRVGGRGYGEEGRLYTDSRAQEHYAGAKAAGLRVGAYFFSQATTVEEAVEEAQFALEQVKDWELDLPMVYDWEYVSQTARTANVDARTLTNCTLAFCRQIEQAGLQAMVYFNWKQSQDLLYMEELTDYPFWLAYYSQEMTYPFRVDFWQYTCTGSVPGIEGNVDINIYLPS